ncbi:MAG: hypothetical protein Q4B34_00015 [Candidatus Saccharibacteria bacterium]|nr:hypothetical protein [Candidatus Saccharibacteria bacterium]
MGKNKIKRGLISGLIFVVAMTMFSGIFTGMAYAALSDNGIKYYLPGCYRSESGDNYTFKFQVYQYPENGDRKAVFEAIQDVPKKSVSGEKVTEQCGNLGALYLGGATNTVQYNAKQAQESIDSVLKNGGWKVTVDETGSSETTVKYPQYYMDCRVFGYDGKKHNVGVTVRKKTDANTSTQIFSAQVNDIKGKSPGFEESCAKLGITTDDHPHTEDEANTFINKVKNDATNSWEVTIDLTSSGASDPNKYFITCTYSPNLGGAEIESTHLMLYQGDLNTGSYSHLYGADLSTNKTIGYRSCQTWLGISNSANRLEITKEKHDEILGIIDQQKEADRQAAEDYQSGNSSITPEDTCLSAGGAGSMGWIVCPVIEWIGGAVTSMYEGTIKENLNIQPELFSATTNSNKSTKDAWEVFRNIANTIFGILFVVVIFSQLTGIGIDNYGIKRILPKLIVAAILVNLSYILCLVAVDLSNILGNGIQKMFEGWAGNPEVMGESMMGSSSGAGGLVVGGAIAGIGILGILFVILGAIATDGAILLTILVAFIGVLISVFFLFVILSVRKVAIIVLTVVSPVAFVCYMLPNLKKSVFDKWLSALKGLLLVYPICGFLIGGGNFVASLIVATGSDNFWLAITAMIASIAPVFFIPTILKSSMAVLGNLGAKISSFGARMRAGTDRSMRGSAWYQNAQKRGQERRTQLKAGLDRDGNPTDKHKWARAWTSKGRARATRAAIATAAENRELEKYKDPNYAAIVAEELEEKQMARQITAELRSGNLGGKTPNDYLADELTDAANNNNAARVKAITNEMIARKQYDEAFAAMKRATRANAGTQLAFHSNIVDNHGKAMKTKTPARFQESKAAVSALSGLAKSSVPVSTIGNLTANNDALVANAENMVKMLEDGVMADMSGASFRDFKDLMNIDASAIADATDRARVENAQTSIKNYAQRQFEVAGGTSGADQSRIDVMKAWSDGSSVAQQQAARESQLAAQQEQIFNVQQEQSAQASGPSANAINYGSGVGGSTITINAGEFAMPSSFQTSKVSSTYVTAKDGTKHHLLSHDGKIWDATAGEYMKENKFKNT